jgi:hypothetical protein
MSDPVTIEKCDECGESFNLPMRKIHRGSGWMPGDASLGFSYCGDSLDDLDIPTCCPDCVAEVTAAISSVLERISSAKEKK